MRTMACVVMFLVVAGCGSRDPDAADIAANNRGVGLMGMYEYGEAREVFAALAEQHPGWVDVKVNLAIATLNRQEEGDEQQALVILEEALARAPDNLRARYCAGLLQYRLGEPAALDHFRRVAEADPGDPYVAYFYGSALEQAGRSDEALVQYRRALELDPYLRSACYRLSRILLRTGRSEEGLALQETFQKLADNPRARTVDFIYTELGPKAEALAVGLTRRKPAPKPAGAVFADRQPLLSDGGTRVWTQAPADRPRSVTACDVNGDQRTDVFIADALGDAGIPNAVILAGDAGFALDTRHPLAAVAGVNAALWGDYDNDGLTDVYLCRRGPNQLWRQDAPGAWTDVTSATGTGNGDADTVDGAMFDADHDGDLDIFCVNGDAPNELLNNNLDGTFRPIASASGLAGDGRPSRQVLVTDLDHDRDADIVVINAQPPNEVYLNDRLWRYSPADGFADLRDTRLVAAVAGDLDADGRVEVYGRDADGSILGVAGDAVGLPQTNTGQGGVPLAIADLDGDGTCEVFGRGYAGWTLLVESPGHGPAIVGIPDAGPPIIERPGPGRYTFAALRFSGMEDPGQSMRSNASGIGARAAARVESRWTVFDTFRSSSGPGQGLQPVAVGLGGGDRIDFVAIDWPDGVLQSEIDLAGGELHVIRETQRQVSSCPVLFGFNGERFEFISDLLGVGGIGYMVAPGEYSTPRPRESFLLPPETLKPAGGRYLLKLGEPMEEACYLDAAALVAHDLPDGWNVVLDERMGIMGPEPTGAPRYYRTELPPVEAVTDRGEDVTQTLLAADLRAAPVGALDRRFIGRLEQPYSVTLTFDEPLTSRPGEPLLVADGWIEYPYSQTMFSAWQAGAEFVAPTLEALGADGQWHTVLEQFGYPAGMPRRMSVPLDDLPAGTRRLRLTTNQEIYWDRLAVAFVETPAEVTVRTLGLVSARVGRPGFARRTTGPQRQPHYDYGRRSPFWDTRHQAGWYTAFGPATELVSAADGALAVFGPGEEVHLEFRADLEPLAPGWTRTLVLETRGWCKDMDLFTRDGETVGPLPGDRHERAETLHRKYNTRYEGG